MSAVLFVMLLGALLAPYLVWSFRHLPEEQWQMLAAVPRRKQPDGRWEGLNLTYYGLISAASFAGALALLVVLLGSIGAGPVEMVALALPLMLIAVPGARWMSRLVERKRFGFTTGGASFLAFVALPWLAWAIDVLVPGLSLPPLASVAAVVLAYALGEGVGRTACVSFGCCYGKPVSACRGRLARLFGRWSFVYRGATKKIAYASHLEGQKVVPVQAVTSVLHVIVALAGVVLFLSGRFRLALALPAIATQIWRFASEFLRADERGGGRLSVYQRLALASAAYLAAAAWLLPAQPGLEPSLAAGLRALWSPGALLFVQAVGAAIFLYSGVSRVTGAHLTFHIHGDRI